MKQQEMRRPLVQSALILLGVILLIGFVAGSDTHGIAGGITSIFKGIFYSLLFAVALCISLVISIFLLIAIFLAAVALYSPDKAAGMYAKLRQSLFGYYSSVAAGKAAHPAPAAAEIPKEEASGKAPTAPVSPPVRQTEAAPASPASDPLDDIRNQFADEIATLRQSVDNLNAKNQEVTKSLDTLQASLNDLPVKAVSEKTDKLEGEQHSLHGKLEECITQIESLKTTAEEGLKLAKAQSSDIIESKKKVDLFASQLAELQQPSGVQQEPAPTAADIDEEKYRIFSYFANDSDKQKFAALVQEAVSKEMTYAEIDKFLSKSLPQKVDAIIKDHPSLTKTYIREMKK